MIVDPFTTTTLVAALAPNETVAPGMKLVPVIVTDVPPGRGPVFGVTLKTVGLGVADVLKEITANAQKVSLPLNAAEDCPGGAAS